MHFSLATITAFSSIFSSLAHAIPAPSSLAPPDDDICLALDFHVKNFKATTKNGGKTLDSFHFTYTEPVNKISTFCQFNSSSISTTPEGLTPRFACDIGGVVKFIYTDDRKLLTMVQRVCPDEQGKATAELGGDVSLKLDCKTAKGKCVSTIKDNKGRFVSINPVIDPTL